MLRDFVEGEGYLSEVAVNGEEALLLLGAVSPDIILLDAVMPGLDGFETCRLIKAREGAAHIPVIFMTGLSETEHVVQGLEAGGVDYVTKPLALDALVGERQRSGDHPRNIVVNNAKVPAQLTASAIAS
ncbi:response regulator [Novosphingobium sp. G106]|nr:response regulator [Novosphingobium sp. G106]